MQSRSWDDEVSVSSSQLSHTTRDPCAERPNEDVMSSYSEPMALLSRSCYLLCSGRSSADANQEEWLERTHLGKDAVGK